MAPQDGVHRRWRWTRSRASLRCWKSAASGEIAEIYADIRTTLGTSVVNLIWRNLATMPGALQWTWSTVRPLYLGPAAVHAEAVRRTLSLPKVPPLSADTLTAPGLSANALEEIRTILDSYHHTNALALVVLSALLEHYDPGAVEAVQLIDTLRRCRIEPNCRRCRRWQRCSSEVRRLIAELNEFGEDGAPFLIASMYRHLAYWPPYLGNRPHHARTLQADGSLNALTRAARALGRAHGKVLSRQLEPRQSAAVDARRTCVMPAVCRASDRPDDRDLRPDPRCHTRRNTAASREARTAVTTAWADTQARRHWSDCRRDNWRVR